MASRERFGSDRFTAVDLGEIGPPPGWSRPAPEDGHRLLCAFVTIRRPRVREAIIELVTKLSAAEPAAE